MKLEAPRRGPERESTEAVVARGRQRVWIAGVALLALLGVVGVRGVQLAVMPAEQTLAAADKQRWGSVRQAARRGSIYDRNGRRLATSVATPNIVVDPQRVDPEDLDALARSVADILGLDVGEVAEKMGRQSRYARLASRVHPSLAARIDDLEHPALWAERGARRYYPEEELASAVIGFVDNSGTGRSGLERYLDDQLRGGSLLQQQRRDRRGGSIDHTRRRDDYMGMDVYTTLDRSVQRMAERALEGVIERSDPVSASIVVMDVKTGDVIAMANVPTFNPNAVGDDAESRKNHTIQDAIEPGSVIKPFTVAAAIEEGLVSTKTLIDCEGGKRYRIGRASIGDDHPKGVITVSEVLKYSSNIGTAKLALQLGASRLVGYLHKFGIGKRTGIQLPGERTGVIRNVERIKPIELATTAYGQGMTTTVLQIASGTATLANLGKRMRPRLVQRIEDLHGVPEYIQTPTVEGRVVSEATARQVLEAMVTVTQRGGTATTAQVPGYLVGGKTGTAEKVVNGQYSSTARVGSFMGFLPANDPKLAIVVTVDEPRKGSRYGGSVAGPAFQALAIEAMRYYQIPPDPSVVTDRPVPPPPGVVAPAVAARPVVTDAVASDAVAQLDPRPVRLAWNGDKWTVPNFGGMSMRQVLRGVQGTGLAVDLKGSGNVTGQSPPAGSHLAPGETVTITLD